MENIDKVMPILEIEKLVNAAIRPDDLVTKPNQFIKMKRIVGRRDPLTELQQKIVIAAISLIDKVREADPNQTACKMEMNEFLKICDLSHEHTMYNHLTGQIEKMLTKGVSLYDESNKKLIRTVWFQAIEYTDREIIFQFAEKALPVILHFAHRDAEHRLVKELQYKGKHTLAVFGIIWEGKDKGVVEYTIPQLMQLLSLEHTRYSYGQLKLRVLEPALEEIYAWDDTIFVRFGPTFSGRRVEGIWFEVTTGEAAKELRKKEPEFKFALPEQKPTKEF